MELDPTQLLVAIKSYARLNPIPLDSSEVHGSLEAAQAYAQSPTAYPGQTIKALVDGEYVSYVLNGDKAPFSLSKVGSVDADDLKAYVQIVYQLPEEGQEQGVIYVCTSDSCGYIYDGDEYKLIFQDVRDGMSEFEDKLGEKAPLDSPTFSGVVTLPGDPTGDMEAATKQYVDRLVEGIATNAPGIVDSSNPLPDDDYKAGQMWRVAETGTYAGEVCEPGDLIICVADYVSGSASNSDFIVLQSNIDGAVVGPDSATDANIVVFDGTTGKRIANSTVTIASVKDAVAKAHEHSNKEILDSYDKSQEDLLEAAAEDAQSKADAVKSELEGTIGDLKDTVDGFDSRIESVEQAVEGVDDFVTKEELSERIGEIPESTDVKTYIDNAIGSGGTSSAEAIATAKQEAIEAAKEYTDAVMTIVEY